MKNQFVFRLAFVAVMLLFSTLTKAQNARKPLITLDGITIDLQMVIKDIPVRIFVEKPRPPAAPQDREVVDKAGFRQNNNQNHGRSALKKFQVRNKK